MMNKLISIKNEKDLPEIYRKTPIERLVFSHNMSLPPDSYERADVLVLMCMDSRQELRLPHNFAFYVRNSGGTQSGVSFSVSFAIAVGGIRYIAVIGHSDCMMVNLEARMGNFVKGLSKHARWDRAEAESHFLDMCGQFEKRDTVGSVIAEAEFIRSQYPGVIVAPLFYSIEDHLLYLIE